MLNQNLIGFGVIFTLIYGTMMYLKPAPDPEPTLTEDQLSRDALVDLTNKMPDWRARLVEHEYNRGRGRMTASEAKRCVDDASIVWSNRKRLWSEHNWIKLRGDEAKDVIDACLPLTQ